MNGQFHTRRRKRLAVLLLFAASCVVAAILFELGVRLLEPQPEEPYQYSPYTYYEPVPGADFVYSRSEFRIPVHFNRFGMRDLERSLSKPEGVRRIALLGDSFAEALQVPQDSMLSQRLEGALQDCLSGEAVEVLNFGVSGYGTAACAARYARLARRFEPDLVLYLFVRNDPWDLVQQDRRLYEIQGDRLVLRPLETSWSQSLAHRLVDFGKHHFHAQRFLKYRLLRWRQGAARAAAQGNDGEARPGETAWRRVEMALVMLRDMAAADGALLVVAQATSAGPAMDAELSRVCQDLELPFFNLVPGLEAAPEPVFFRIDGHWQSRGHGVASQALAPWLCSFLERRRDRGTGPTGTSEGESDLYCEGNVALGRPHRRQGCRS